MKHGSLIALLLAAALLLSLLAGCAGETGPSARSTGPASAGSTEPAPETTEPAPETTAPVPETTAPVPETTEPAPEATEPLPVRWRNGGPLRFLPQEPIEMVPLSEMVYERPDTEALLAELEALTEKASGCDDPEALLADYYAFYRHYCSFSTMFNLAYLRFCQDKSERCYADEYDYLGKQDAVLAEKMEAVCAAFAASPCRTALEQAYFGDGFFELYDDYEAVDAEYYALAAQENELISQYYELTSYDCDMWDDSWVRREHKDLGELFISMVRVRQQLAAEKGCENYMDYCYAECFARDYTPAQAREYLDLVKECLAPMADEDELWDYWYVDAKSAEVEKRLAVAAEAMGGPIWEAYRFMTAYGLCDAGVSAHKRNTGFTGYLRDYETPVIFLAPNNSSVTDLSHEFGHFVDDYVNYGDMENREISEIYSQVMEYLALVYGGLGRTERDADLRALLANKLLYTILEDSAYADFELRVYALAPEELTLTNVDAIFRQCMLDYGMIGTRASNVEDMRWIGYHHFFDYPGYVVSYTTSAVAALEICEQEAAQSGAGVEAFCRLLNRTHGEKFAFVLQEAGLGSPFERQTLEGIAAFLKGVFRIK